MQNQFVTWTCPQLQQTGEPINFERPGENFPISRRLSITFSDTVMIMGLAQRRNSSPGAPSYILGIVALVRL